MDFEELDDELNLYFLFQHYKHKFSLLSKFNIRGEVPMYMTYCFDTNRGPSRWELLIGYATTVENDFDLSLTALEHFNEDIGTRYSWSGKSKHFIEVMLLVESKIKKTLMTKYGLLT